MVEDELAGQPAQCQCGNVFTVPDKTVIPWKDYYLLSWHNLVRIAEQFLLPIQLLHRELTCYWGFLIARQGEEIGLAKFVPIKLEYDEYNEVSGKLLAAQDAVSADKLAARLHKLSYQIGSHCYRSQINLRKFSEIAQITDQLRHLDDIIRRPKNSERFLRYSAQELPLWLTPIVVFPLGVVVLSLVLHFVLSLLSLPWLWQLSLFASALIAVLALVVVAQVCLVRERARLKSVWADNLRQLADAYLPPELMADWLEKLYDSPRLRRWQYQPPFPVVVPDELVSDFIPDIVFPEDTPKTFTSDISDDERQWCERLYEFCRESFTGNGCIDFCFLYSENLPLLEKFLVQIAEIFSEYNQTEAQRTLIIARQPFTTCERLGGIMYALDPLFDPRHYPDYSWQRLCEFFHNLRLLLRIYDALAIPAETDDDLQTPVFVEIFAGLRHCLYSLAKRLPILVVLERIDNCDPLSLRFLCSLTVEDREHRLCFLVSYQRENVHKMPLLKRTILQLQKQHCWKTPEKQVCHHNLAKAFVGKQQQWQQLQQCFHHAVSTPTLQVIGIAAESGQGKTFLGSRFLDHYAANDGLWLLFYSYSRSGLDDPCIFQPFKKMMDYFKAERSCFDAAVGDRIAALADILGGEMSALPPSTETVQTVFHKNPLRQKMEFDSSALAEGQIIIERQRRLWAEMQEVIAAIAATRPIICFLDDLHLADTASLNFLAELTHQAPAAPFFLIFSWDANAISLSNRSFEEFITRMGQSEHYLQLPLAPLTPQEIVGYLAESFEPNLLGDSDTSPFIQLLAQASHGNALLLTEFLKLLVNQKLIYPFGGFWILKEDIGKDSLTSAALLKGFVEQLTPEEKPLLYSLLRESAVYGDSFPTAWAQTTMQQLGIPWPEIHNILERWLPRQILLSTGNRKEYLDFVHRQYRLSLLDSLPGQQKKEMHRRLLPYIENSEDRAIPRLLFHAEQAGEWTTVLQYAEVAGRHCLRLFELTSASEIFDKGIIAAHNLEDLPALARYSLLKSRTFPENRAYVPLDSLIASLEQQQWHQACEICNHTGQQEKAAQALLASLTTLGTSQREAGSRLLEHALTIITAIPSEYLRAQLLHQAIGLLKKSEPLKLRSLVEQALPIAQHLSDSGTRAHLYLALQQQLGEMDLDLIELLARSISPEQTAREKALALYYLATFLPKNHDLADSLLQQASEIDNCVDQIMAMRAVAVYTLNVAADKAAKVLQAIVASLKDISSHPRRMEAVNALLSGADALSQRPDFHRIISELARPAQLQLVTALITIVKETPKVSGRLLALERLASILSMVAAGEILEERLEEIVAELRHLSDSFERGQGLIQIAAGVVNENINLAYRYLEDGLNEIGSCNPGQLNNRQETLAARLRHAFALFDKLPQPLTYPLWEKIIEIVAKTNQSGKEMLFSEMVPQLFIVDPEKAMEIAGQIHSLSGRCQAMRLLLDLTPERVSSETIEQAVIEHSIDEYGGILLQELALKDLGRARQLLERLPVSLDTKIARALLCRLPGQRIDEILALTAGVVDDGKSMDKIFSALETILQRKEYDHQGYHAVLEVIADNFPRKIDILLRIALVTQEIDANLASESFVKAMFLAEKHWQELGEHHPLLRERLEAIAELLTQLQPSFVETYSGKLIPEAEMISAPELRALFIKGLCHKLYEISADSFRDTLEKLPPESRFKTIESMREQYRQTELAAPALLKDSALHHEMIEALTSLSMIKLKARKKAKCYANIWKKISCHCRSQNRE